MGRRNGYRCRIRERDEVEIQIEIDILDSTAARGTAKFVTLPELIVIPQLAPERILADRLNLIRLAALGANITAVIAFAAAQHKKQDTQRSSGAQEKWNLFFDKHGAKYARPCR